MSTSTREHATGGGRHHQNARPASIRPSGRLRPESPADFARMRSDSSAASLKRCPRLPVSAPNSTLTRPHRHGLIEADACRFHPDRQIAHPLASSRPSDGCSSLEARSGALDRSAECAGFTARWPSGAGRDPGKRGGQGKFSSRALGAASLAARPAAGRAGERSPGRSAARPSSEPRMRGGPAAGRCLAGKWRTGEDSNSRPPDS